MCLKFRTLFVYLFCPNFFFMVVWVSAPSISQVLQFLFFLPCGPAAGLLRLSRLPAFAELWYLPEPSQARGSSLGEAGCTCWRVQVAMKPRILNSCVQCNYTNWFEWKTTVDQCFRRDPLCKRQTQKKHMQQIVKSNRFLRDADATWAWCNDVRKVEVQGKNKTKRREQGRQRMLLTTATYIRGLRRRCWIWEGQRRGDLSKTNINPGQSQHQPATDTSRAQAKYNSVRKTTQGRTYTWTMGTCSVQPSPHWETIQA